MVEDEVLILEIMSETLEDEGYEVVTAHDGVQAVALLDANPGRFTGLFSDYHLPGGLTGIDVARAARLRNPGLPVVLATGRPDVLEAEWRAVDGFVLLRKPYGPAEMVNALGTVVRPSGKPANRP